MAKGLIHGANVLLVVGIVILLFATLSPMWLVVRSEVGLKQCWFGQGIWIAEYWWGDDLTKANIKCRDPLGRGPISSSDEYCNASPHTDYTRAMCTATVRAKQSTAVALGCLAACTLTFMLLRKHFRTMFYAHVVSVFLCLVSISSSLATTWIMLSSPLFKEEHITQLSRKYNNGPIPLALFSCSLQTILKIDPATLLPASAPNECVFPGPSALAMLVYFITQAMLLGFLLMLCKMEYRTFRKQSSSSPSTAAMWSDDEDEEERDVLPATFHKVRRYSMHGAIARRFAHLKPVRRFLLLTAMPVTLMMGNAASWLAYILLGIQIIVNAKIRIVKNSHLNEMSYFTMEIDNPVLPQGMSLVMNQALAQYNSTAEFSIPEKLLFDDNVNAFNFSPATSVYFFWTTGAYLICIGMFGAIFALPITKVVVWIWVYFTPFPEIGRGRALMILDAVGKYSLANLYMLILISIALIFRSNFIVVPISRQMSFLVQVGAGTSAGNGIGSYMFTATCILSLSIGQYMVQLHSMCSSWEEDRRSKDGSLLASPMTTSMNSPAAYLDTPSLASSSLHNRNNVVTGSGITSPLLRRNNLRASFVDLSNLHGASSRNNSQRNVLDHSNHSSQEHVPDIVRALAKYGSRAALQVMSRKSAQQGATSPLQRLSSLREEKRIFRQKMQLHPHVEALCDRVHSPEHGVQLKFTPAGKIFVWFLVFFVSGIMLVCQSVPIFEVHRSGLIGDVVVKPKQRYQSYSLLSLTTATADMGFEVPAVELATLFFLMTAVMPMLTAWGLAMLWGIPLTLERQERLFNFLEIASAWSSLDIFFLSITAIYIEIQQVISNMINAAVPNVSLLIKIFLPFEDGPLKSSFRLEFGFWILLLAVILEKIAIILLTEGAVQAISERRAERFLKALAKQQDQQEQSPLVNARLLADAAEGLLESDAILAFAPAGRYFTAMFPRSIYAGIPRGWWNTYGVRCGLLADARSVTLYDLTGKTLEEFDDDEDDDDDEDEDEEEYGSRIRRHHTGGRRSIIDVTEEDEEERNDSMGNEIHYEYVMNRQESPFGGFDEEDTGPISF